MVSQKDVTDLLDRLDISFRIDKSTAMSDRHGASQSVYFLTERAKVRLSDHDYVGTDVELRYWMTIEEAEALVRSAFGLPVSEHLQSSADENQRTREAQWHQEWLRSPEGLAAAAASEKKAAVEARVASDIRALGLSHLTGRAKRQLHAELISRAGQKRYFPGRKVTP